MKKFLSTLLYTAAATLLFSACGMTANTVSSPVEPTVKSNEKTAVNNTALVYFSKDISPVSLIKLYDKINQDIHGKVAIKIHTGEKNGHLYRKCWFRLNYCQVHAASKRRQTFSGNVDR